MSEQAPVLDASEEQQHLIQDLKEKEMKATDAEKWVDPNSHTSWEDGPQTATSRLVGLGNVAVTSVQAYRAEKRAVKHYRQNEAEIHQIALNEDEMRDSHQKAA